MKTTDYNWLENADGKLVHGYLATICGECWFIEDEQSYIEPDDDAIDSEKSLLQYLDYTNKLNDMLD